MGYGVDASWSGPPHPPSSGAGDDGRAGPLGGVSPARERRSEAWLGTVRHKRGLAHGRNLCGRSRRQHRIRYCQRRIGEGRARSASAAEGEHMSVGNAAPGQAAGPSRMSAGYEFGLVVLMFFTWGTVFLDRMSVLYLAPYIAPDLHLTHAQVGLLASSLAVAWAVAGLVFGAISDRIGRRPVLVPAVFVFSALSWLSGLVRSFGQLFVVRTLMGTAEGPTWATITATIEESSAPERRGRNVGVVVSAAALVGLALAPVLTTQIAARYGWRAACFVAGFPGIVLGVLLWKFIKEPGKNILAGHHKSSWSKSFSLLRYRNMWLCCLASAGFMTWLWVMHAFAPLYITEVTKNSATFAGLVLSASGLGAFLCGLVLPWVSDYTGRKPALLLVALVSALVPLTYQMPFLIRHPWL